MAKYGGEQSYKRAQEVKIEKAQKRREIKEEKEKVAREEKKREHLRRNPPPEIDEERKEELEAYLKSIGLSGIRSDSVLCRNYIVKKGNDKCEFTKEQIGDIMLEMNFYYSKTTYNSCLSKIRSEKRRNYRDNFWEKVSQEDMRDEAKYNSLFTYIKNHFQKDIQSETEFSTLNLKNIPKSLYEQVEVIYSFLCKHRKKRNKKNLHKILRQHMVHKNM